MTQAGPLPGTGRAPASEQRCSGCGAIVPAEQPFTMRCPAARAGDDIDHVLRRRLDLDRVEASDLAEQNPFLRYRTRFHSYHVARAAGWSDQRFVDLVGTLDDAIAKVDGAGFGITLALRAPALDQQLGFQSGGGVWIKDETGNVSGSHKARHLMGVMLDLEVGASLGLVDRAAPLAIASCGNAALAAAVVARAAERPLRVFVPTDAERAIVARLHSLGADIVVCERQPGESGDPTYLRLLEAVDQGAVPFTVQGNLDGLAIEGGATLGWELIDQVTTLGTTLDRIVIQVGGGALASAQAMAFEESQRLGQLAAMPRFDTVQAEGGYPLARAYERVLFHLDVAAGTQVAPDVLDEELRHASQRRSDYMWAWESAPTSIAHGILDDETYDWLAVVRAMLSTGGQCVTVSEKTLEEANAFARSDVGSNADHTGTAGLAGLIQLTRDGLVGTDENVAVIFSGARRSPGTDQQQ